jgi:hypothetical protein
MHIHILGICGTFMGSLAVLAKDWAIASPAPTPTSIRP